MRVRLGSARTPWRGCLPNRLPSEVALWVSTVAGGRYKEHAATFAECSVTGMGLATMSRANGFNFIVRTNLQHQEDLWQMIKALRREHPSGDELPSKRRRTGGGHASRWCGGGGAARVEGGASASASSGGGGGGGCGAEGRLAELPSAELRLVDLLVQPRDHLTQPTTTDRSNPREHETTAAPSRVNTAFQTQSM